MDELIKTEREKNKKQKTYIALTPVGCDLFEVKNPFTRIEYYISCLSDIYNNSRITVMK